MVKTETKLTNESGYVFLVMDCEDQVIAGFYRLEHALEGLQMSFPDEAVVRLDDRDVGLERYAVILRDPCNGGEEEYRGCLRKLPMCSIPQGMIGLS